MASLHSSSAGLGYRQMRNTIIETIPKFISACFDKAFDVIIPVESEGLALFLASLGKHEQQRIGDIVPSSVLERHESTAFKGKRLLVVDVSINSGHTVSDIVDDIRAKFGVEPKIAALFVKRGYEYFDHLEFTGFEPFSPNQYVWAREVLIEFLLDEVFVRSGDPPLWELSFNQNDRSELMRALLDIGVSYGLPREIGSWIRITIDNIHLSNNDWLPKSFKADGSHRIRLLFHRERNVLRILPLFFPKIPNESKVTPSEVLKYAKKSFGKSLKEFDLLSEIVKRGSLFPYPSFRLTSALGSVHLLADFASILSNAGVRLAWSEISAPSVIRILYQILGREQYLDALQALTRSMFASSSKTEQLVLPNYYFFRFDKVEQGILGSAFITPESLPGLSLEECVIGALGKWLNRQKENRRHQHIGEDVLSFQDIVNLAKDISPFGVSRAIDTLIDEGILKPRISAHSDFMTRTYGFGGETILRRIRAYGLAFLAMEKQHQDKL